MVLGKRMRLYWRRSTKEPETNQPMGTANPVGGNHKECTKQKKGGIRLNCKLSNGQTGLLLSVVQKEK